MSNNEDAGLSFEIPCSAACKYSSIYVCHRNANSR